MRYDLSYEQFKEQITQDIKNYLSEEYQNADISIQKVTKQGDGVYDGLMIKKEGQNISPTIYLDDMYKVDYRDGKSMDDIMQKIADIRCDFDVTTEVNTNELTNFEAMKDKIVARVLNPKTNAEYLSNKPHVMFNDMAVMFAAELGNLPDNMGNSGQGSMPITDSLLELYGVSVEELKEVAVENMERQGASIRPMMQVLIDMMGPDIPFAELPDDLKLLVVTNNKTLHGSAMMLNPDAMEKVSEMICGDFAIIPSSVHEILALPIEGVEERNLNQMINEVNLTTVANNEILSDHIYVYDADKGQVVMPEVYFERDHFDPEHTTGQAWEEFKENARMSYMEPEFDGAHNEYYGNAKVFELFGDQVLESYGKPIAFSHDGETKLLSDDILSPAQSNHAVEFANQTARSQKFTSVSEIPAYKAEQVKEAPAQEHAKQPTAYAKQQLFDQDKGIGRA